MCASKLGTSFVNFLQILEIARLNFLDRTECSQVERWLFLSTKWQCLLMSTYDNDC